jgi:sulfate adenylyltransferase large subunit
VLEQSRRHAFISALLGIRRLLIAVNKMDLAGFEHDVFDGIRRDFERLRPRLRDVDMTFIPVSALEGDNVVERSPRTPWYEGPSLLEFLETVEPEAARDEEVFRFPVQLVIRPNLDFRGFAGQVASGRVRVGDEVAVLPSARRTRIARIVTFDGDLEEAHAPMSVTLTLEDEIELSRGGLITEPARAPQVSRRVEATLVWMSQAALKAGKSYLLRHGPHEVQARVTRVLNRVDVGSLERHAAETLGLNEIGLVTIDAAQPLAFDPYARIRGTGGFVLLDPLTNLTLAAGMLERVAPASASVEGPVTAAERRRRTGHGGCLVTADAGSPEAAELERWLFRHGAEVLRVQREVQPVESLLDGGFIVIAPQGLPAGSRHKSVDLREFAGAIEPVVARLIALGVWDDRDSFTAGEGI